MDRALTEVERAVRAAALDPAAWPGVTAALAASFDGVRAAFVGYDTWLTRSLPAAEAGYDPSFVASYYAHYHALNPLVPGWIAQPVGRIVSESDLVPEDEFLRSAYYHEWVRPQGDIRRAVGGVLARGPGRLCLLSCHVEARWSDRVTGPLVAALERLHPSMQHALDLNRMMLGLRLDAEALRHGVDPDGAAVLLLSREGRIVYADARAQEMLDQGTPILHDGEGRLRLAGGADQDGLEAALAVPGRLLASRTRAKGLGYEVHVLPLGPSAGDGLPMLSGPAPAALVALRPLRGREGEVERVMRGLGLPRAEAEVALALAGGATPAEVAEARGASLHTVRNQIKAAMARLGLRRQAELAVAVERARR